MAKILFVLPALFAAFTLSEIFAPVVSALQNLPF